MARVVKALGYGGQYYVEKEFHWNRETLKKGKQELESGEAIIDNFSGRGKKRIEEKLPNLSIDIKSIVDGEAQTDPTFKTTKKILETDEIFENLKKMHQKCEADESILRISMDEVEKKII
ncbi:MAG: hypothetical protein Q9M36_05210 [Sulfurovum sp.]|nr:hypothetical protein [Sulfurovum sp.]